MTNQSASRPRKRWWLGCLGCSGLLILSCFALGGLSLLTGPLLHRLRPSAQELYSAAPDPAASAAVKQVFEDADLSGVGVVVIPIQGHDGQIAIVNIDDSVQGADSVSGDDAKFSQVITELSQANQDQDLHIERVSVFYNVGSGGEAIGMTAPQEMIDAYAAGQISQREFLSHVDVDISSIISYQDLMKLLQESQQ